jgi:hypothetical protein
MKCEVFPLNSRLVMVGQDGAVSPPTREKAVLFLHWPDGAVVPNCAELVTDRLHAEIGLIWRGTTLIDYDGVFDLPADLVEVLRAKGFSIGEELMDDGDPDAPVRESEPVCIRLNRREHATVLAALRHWQQTYRECLEELPEWGIATDEGALEPLNPDEIDRLCARLNEGGAP